MDPLTARLKLAVAALARSFFPTRAMFEAFGTPEGILGASARELERIEGLGSASICEWIRLWESPCPPEPMAQIQTGGIRVVSFEDPEYPDNLRNIPDPPPVLFLKGRIQPGDEHALAVIGSRRATPYGISVCERLVRELLERGFRIVSGMARGIDAAAHWAALDGGGRTMAVLGTGVDVIYPKVNRTLFEAVTRRGVLASEFVPGTPAHAKNFPRRNRIISGMALGVLVVEAAERSGTMITVRTALEQGREVFAVPGDVRSPFSRGTHRLIKQGAKLVDGVVDVLEELGVPMEGCTASGSGVGRTVPSQAELVPEGLEETTEEASLLGLIGDKGASLDGLVSRTGWPSEKVARLLTELEVVGKVKRLPGNRVYRETCLKGC